MVPPEIKMAKETSLRDMTAEQGVLSRPDGSVSYHQGETAVIAAVYGPAEVLIRKELVDRATVELSYVRKSGLPACKDRAEESYLSGTCESVILSALHPRTCIRIILQELQNSGSLAACAVNASCLALLDAAIPLRHLIASVACIITQEDVLILDPTHRQEKDAKTTMLFAFESENMHVISSRVHGAVSDEEYQTSVCACREASKDIFKFYREAMERKLNKIV